jgi:membrane associated rhomboid family serine protease/cytochrome c-type biogenesis protein CcmH/NrfG
MQACPSCGSQLEVDAEGHLHCPQCQTPQFETAAPPARKRDSLPISFYLQSPTVWLIAVNVLVFLVVCARSHQFMDIDVEMLLRYGANFGTKTLTSQPWRLETATFLHGGFFHIALNMWALFNLGILGEILFGRRSFTVMYFLCGIAGSIASVWWHFHTGNIGVVGVGASGAIFGIAGALIPALALQKNARLRVALKGNLTSIIIFVAYTVAYGAKAAHIDNSAHLGGLAAGLVMGLALPSSPGWDKQHHTARRAIIFIAVALALYAAFFYVRRTQVAVLEFARAQAAYQKQDFATAISLLNSSLQRDPRSVDSHLLLGLIYLQQDKNEEARRQFSTTVQIAPDWATGHGQLCIAYLRLRDAEHALESCKRAVELDPKDPDKQFNLGLTQRANNDLQGAVNSFFKAEQLRPNRFDEEAMLGEALVDVGRYDEAIDHLQRALKARPSDRHVRLLLARLLMIRGQRDAAQKLLGK